MPCWKSRACRPCWIRLTIKSGPGNVAIFKSRPQVGFFFVLYVVCSCLAGSMAARFCRKGLFKDDEAGRAVELLTDQVTLSNARGNCLQSADSAESKSLGAAVVGTKNLKTGYSIFCLQKKE